jgi:ferrochelatase
MKTEFLLANFGGPRDLNEIAPFLEELLCDRDVIWTRFPTFFHNWFFRRIARKRALRIRHDYQFIGGRSPIYFDTEELAKKIGAIAFHRYLPSTHADSLAKIERSDADEIRVLPLFPQFTYATTGSIARFFAKHLSPKAEAKLRWIRSYPDHPAFVSSFQRRIRSFLEENQLEEEETALLFSAHGVPKTFIDHGDPYQRECERSFQAIRKGFPSALGLLAYQSKFGRGEWIRPYTIERSETALQWSEGRKNIVFVPLTFTSDHIETLFEIETQYLPPVKAQGLNAYRCPALNLEPDWIEAMKSLFQTPQLQPNAALIR